MVFALQLGDLVRHKHLGGIGIIIDEKTIVSNITMTSARKFIVEWLVSDLYQNSEDRRRLNEKMLQNGFVRNEELLLKKKDGSPIICSVSAVAARCSTWMRRPSCA